MGDQLWAARTELRAPVLRGKNPSKSTKAHSRHSAMKPKAHGRTSPGGSAAQSLAAARLSVDDSGEELGEDSPGRPLPLGLCDSDGVFGAPAAESPFLAFGAAKNSSPFAAFGAVTKKKVREQPSDPHCPARRARAAG